MNVAKVIAVAFLVWCHALAATAQTVRAEDAIRYRKAVMVMIKWHYDRLSQAAKGSLPLARDEIERNAAWLDALSKNAAEGFVAGSLEGDTKALAAIWRDEAKFRGLVEKFQADAARLRQFARGGEAAALKAPLDAMTRTCKSCHDDFKKS